MGFLFKIKIEFVVPDCVVCSIDYPNLDIELPNQKSKWVESRIPFKEILIISEIVLIVLSQKSILHSHSIQSVKIDRLLLSLVNEINNEKINVEEE